MHVKKIMIQRCTVFKNLYYHVKQYHDFTHSTKHKDPIAVQYLLGTEPACRTVRLVVQQQQFTYSKKLYGRVHINLY
jgi:hypothetical protein